MTENEDQLFREVTLEIVDNQLKSLDPPETKETYDRLMAEGYSREETRSLIAAAIGIEINEMMMKMEPFNLLRFIESLLALPDGPWMENEY